VWRVLTAFGCVSNQTFGSNSVGPSRPVYVLRMLSYTRPKYPRRSIRSTNWWHPRPRSGLVDSVLKSREKPGRLDEGLLALRASTNGSFFLPLRDGQRRSQKKLNADRRATAKPMIVPRRFGQ
jgi:hypothetical protein